MGKKGIRGIKMRVGWKCSISRGGGRLNSGGVRAVGVQGGSHSVTFRRSRNVAGGKAPGVRATKSFEFNEAEQ